MKVYLDNGATTPVAKEVAKAMQAMLTKKFGNPSSLHKFGEEAKKELEKSREIIAKKINAEPDEIIFTSGGTEADNIAIKGVAYKHKQGHIITSKIEHPAVLRACEALEKEGFKVTYLNVNKEGLVDLKRLEEAITPETILITVMHANNEIGTIQDIEKIGKICKEKNVTFHTDAVQSFTKVPIDVKKTNVDLISLSAHKIHGPKGIGALFVKKSTKLKPLFDGGGQERKIRTGTENMPGVAGFGKAVEISEEKDVEKMRRLRNMLIEEIEKNIPDIILNGSRDKRLANNVNITFKYIEGESLLYQLNEKGVAVSTGSACSSQSLEPSHVLIAIGLKPEVAHGAIRFTLSRYTTKEEIDYTIKSLKGIVKELRRISPLTK